MLRFLTAMALVPLLLALTPACAKKPRPPLTGTAGATGNPFAAETVLIHPLTRVLPAGSEPGALPRIIAHIEFADAWGHETKAAGLLQVQLYRPQAGRTSRGAQELTWDADLTDMVNNGNLYDPATRTYRLTLEDAPAWTAEPGARVPLRAVFQTWSQTGEPRTLFAERVLGE